MVLGSGLRPNDAPDLMGVIALWTIIASVTVTGCREGHLLIMR